MTTPALSVTQLFLTANIAIKLEYANPFALPVLLPITQPMVPAVSFAQALSQTALTASKWEATA
jgi:hypothetical protein